MRLDTRKAHDAWQSILMETPRTQHVLSTWLVDARALLEAAAKPTFRCRGHERGSKPGPSLLCCGRFFDSAVDPPRYVFHTTKLTGGRDHPDSRATAIFFGNFHSPGGDLRFGNTARQISISYSSSYGCAGRRYPGDRSILQGAWLFDVKVDATAAPTRQ